MITPAQRAEIRRLYYGEHWKIGTIAAQLGLHPETVRGAVEREPGAVRRGVCRPSALDPYLPFIRDTLARRPRLRATRIHEMVRQRGYPGSAVQVRRLVRRLRPETARTAYRRVVTLPGESAQVDWGAFGKVRIGRGARTVSGFVMVLGCTRAPHADRPRPAARSLVAGPTQTQEKHAMLRDIGSAASVVPIGRPLLQAAQADPEDPAALMRLCGGTGPPKIDDRVKRTAAAAATFPTARSISTPVTEYL